ncbi:MAG TPA: cupin domain-containing protein [Anaerolineaceae bacterium]|jgi:quercetin dioxygenase-like cupin family protein|nr:cupin domain-containing protein [Anaerolineaceae bacterium]
MSVIKHFEENADQFQWNSIQPQEITMEGIAGVTKHILIGRDDQSPHYIMRFFWLEPGGHSMLERHPQEHGVIVLKGKGTIQIGEKVSEVHPYDVAFISPDELHQFNNPYDEPFGFICVIPRLDPHME